MLCCPLQQVLSPEYASRAAAAADAAAAAASAAVTAEQQQQLDTPAASARQSEVSLICIMLRKARQLLRANIALGLVMVVGACAT